jgi:hypothetical protein
VFGDDGTWTWETDGRLATIVNPLMTANLKAKKLRSLLRRQKAFQRKGQPPFIDAFVFCSSPHLRFELEGNARCHVCQRDPIPHNEKNSRPSILSAIMHRECPGLDRYIKGPHDRPMAWSVRRSNRLAFDRPSECAR